MKTYTEQELKDAHKSRPTKEDIENSKFYGCSYCCKTFQPKKKPIKEWVNGKNKDPLCPNCNIDSVLAGNSGFPVNDRNFLNQMHNHWFAISKGGKHTGEIFGGKK